MYCYEAEKMHEEFERWFEVNKKLGSIIGIYVFSSLQNQQHWKYFHANTWFFLFGFSKNLESEIVDKTKSDIFRKARKQVLAK